MLLFYKYIFEKQKNGLYMADTENKIIFNLTS